MPAPRLAAGGEALPSESACSLFSSATLEEEKSALLNEHLQTAAASCGTAKPFCAAKGSQNFQKS